MPGLGRELRPDQRSDYDARSCRREFLGGRADAIEVFPHDPKAQIVGNLERVANVVFVADSEPIGISFLIAQIEQFFRMVLAGVLAFAVAAGAIDLPAELLSF